MKSERIVVDTHAWVEYFIGSSLGEEVKKYVEDKYELLTSTVTLAELKEYSLRHGKDFNSIRSFIQGKSKIIPVDQKVAINAGEVNYRKKRLEKVKDWGIVDSLIFATAQIYKAKILTGDPHFKNLKETIWIGKSH